MDDTGSGTLSLIVIGDAGSSRCFTCIGYNEHAVCVCVHQAGMPFFGTVFGSLLSGHHTSVRGVFVTVYLCTLPVLRPCTAP